MEEAGEEETAAESGETQAPTTAPAPRTPKRRKEEGEAIRTFLRIRPVDLEEEEEATLEKIGSGVVQAQAPESSWAYRNGDDESHEYKFTEVFDYDSQQPEVYKRSAASHVQRLFNGNNGMLVAYGSSGSGKTHTILGSMEQDEGEGVALRVMRRVFDKINCLMTEQEHAISQAAATGEPGPAKCLYFVFVTCHEIYNEQIFDLLADDQPKDLKDRTPRVLKYDMKGKPNVKGQKEVKVESADHGVQLLLNAYKNRVSAATLINDNSSRSHALVTIKLARVRTTTSMEQLHEDPTQHLRVSKMAIVDLAGNERGQKTQSTGTRQQEAGNINLSLMKLGRCIATMRTNQLAGDQQQQVVPFRESKLTRLLQEYFDTRSLTTIVVCVSPAPDCYDEVVQSLKFGLAAQEVAVGTKSKKKAVRNSLYAPTAASKSRDAARTPRASTVATTRTPATARRKRSQSTKAAPVVREEETQRDERGVEFYKEKALELEERMADMEQDIREEVSDELQGILQMMRVTYEQRIQQKLLEEEERFNMRLQLLSGLHMPERQEEHLQSIPSSEELVEWCRNSSQSVNGMGAVGDGEKESPPPPRKRKRRGEEEGDEEAQEESLAPALKMDELHITLQSSYEQLRESHCNLLAEHDRLLGQMEVAKEMDQQKQKQLNQMRIQISSFTMEKEMLEETVHELQDALRQQPTSSASAGEAAMASHDLSFEAEQRQRDVVADLQRQLASAQCDKAMLTNQVTELKELYKMLLAQKSTMARSSSSKSNVLEAGGSEAALAEPPTTPRSSKVQGTLKKILTPKKSLLTPRKRTRNNKEAVAQHTMMQDVDAVNGTTRTFRGEIQPSLTGQGVSVCFTDVEMKETMNTSEFIKANAAAAASKKKGRGRTREGRAVPRLDGLGNSDSSINSQSSQIFGLVDCGSETSVNCSMGDVSSHLMSPVTTEPLESSMMAPMDEWPEGEEGTAPCIADEVYEGFSRPSYLSLSPQGDENERNPTRGQRAGAAAAAKRDSFVEVPIDAISPKAKKGKTKKAKGKAKAKKVDKADRHTPGWSRRLRTRE